MTKTITIDNSSYLIYTEKEEGYFFGCWKNVETGEKGESSKHCETEEDALEFGENNARANCKMKQKNKP